MESWDNLILQWINCLLNNTGDCVQSTEELQDGKKYLILISKVKSFQHKIDDDISERNIIIQFLKDEYPNVVFGTKSRTIENLCIALLILSRLSLEPTFHKSLCTNLNMDAQIRIKSILESLYPLGKKLTIDDLCSTFSLLDKSVGGSLATKRKFLLEDFLNSPVTRSVHSDSKIHEQTRQIRHLQADLETVRYEKSELIEDIKIQKRQIDELHQKLQDTLLELKTLRQDSLRSSDFNGSYEPTTPKSLESSYEKELQSLENYISELQSDNFKLLDEKNNLLDELKNCQSKYVLIEERSLKHEEMIEALLLQIEKKDDELMELKLKYEEIFNYLKEKSKPSFINQSFDVDDRMVSEISMNNSETLSSVIEIQLQDAKKEIIEAQNKYRSINSVLITFMEEYVKVKNSVQVLIKDNVRIRSEYEKKYKIIHEQLQIMLDKEKFQKLSEFEMCRELDLSEIKWNFIKALQTDSGKTSKSLLMDILSQYNDWKGIDQPKNCINFTTTDENDHVVTESSSLSTIKTLQKYQGDKRINNVDKNRLVFKFHDILQQENWRKNLLVFFDALLQNNHNVSGNVTDEATSRENVVVKYNTFDTILEKNLIKCLQEIFNRIEDDEASLISKEDLETIRSEWISLYNDMKDNLKVYKVILLLDKKWNIISESFGNYDYFLIDDMKDLLEMKNTIDTEFSKIYFANSQMLSFNFIAAAQLTTRINKSSKEKLHIEEVNDSILHTSFNTSLENKKIVDLLTHSDCVDKIISIKKIIDDFENLKKVIESKPKIETEYANISMQTENLPVEAEPIAETEYANISIQTECLEIEPVVKISVADVSLQTENFTESTDKSDEPKIEYVDVSFQTEDQLESIVKIECVNVSLQTDDFIQETEPAIKTEYANVSLQTENISEIIETEPAIKTEYANVSLQTENISEIIETEPAAKLDCADVSLQTSIIEPVVKIECANISLQTSIIEPVVKIECANISLQTEDLTEYTERKPELVNVSLQTDSAVELIEPQVPVKIECVNVSMQTDNLEELLETKPITKVKCVDVSLQTENEQVPELILNETKKKMKIEKEILQQQNHDNKENIFNQSAKGRKNVLESDEVQQYVKELHEKYELKLEKMKEKMKSVYNSQMGALKKEQESTVMKKLKSLEEKLKQQCDSHSEELKKYKKHVSELSTQLWEVGDKLLIEKQKKEEAYHRYKELKTKQDIMEAHNSKISKHESMRHAQQTSKAEIERQPLEELEVSSLSKMQNVRNFQVMGNAFRTEDEEGEMFDTTYNLAELQRSQNIPPTNNVDRLSVLQMRNAKCKPHLKSSYPAEMQSYPIPVTEDEIKAGSGLEETFNDSLSQSLLTGKKVKRKDRTRNGSETPRRSTRRFSNIFRKPRLSLDRK